MELLSTVAVWVLLALVSGMRFEAKTSLSDPERERLAQLQDKQAVAEMEAVRRIPLLMSLQTIVKTLGIVAFVFVAIHAFGVLEGGLVAALGLLLVPIVYRVPLIGRWSDALRTMIEPWFHRVLPSLEKPLSWLRERDAIVHETRLNSQEELLALLRRSPGILSKDEQTRFEASLKFDETRVDTIMTPRTMISGVEAHEILGPLVLDELYKTGHSRFPVYKKDLDHMVGILYLHDLIDLKSGERTAEKAMQPKVHYIHEKQTAAQALKGFLRTKHHLFVVVNDYRETVGVLTLEDALEALLGAKIEDEFDAYDDLRAVAASNPKRNNSPEKREDI